MFAGMGKVIIKLVGLVAGLLFFWCNTVPDQQEVNKKPETEKKIELTKAQKETAYCLDTFFSRLYNGNEFNGNVLIARHDTIIFKKSFGCSNFESKSSLNDSSLFQLASVSKTFT